MAISSTYMSDLGRIRVSMSSIPSDADFVKVERSTDGINWTTVRGGETLAVSAGAAKIDDYEFPVGVLVTYRATYVDSADITFVAQGTHATGNNASVVPGLPAGVTVGSTMVLMAAIRNSGTGTVNVPAGWTAQASPGNILVATRRYQAGDAAPTVSFTGGAANASTSAIISAWQNMDPASVAVNFQLNGSSQNVATPLLNITGSKREIIAFEWKQDGAATAGSTLTPFGGTITLANALGSGQSLFYSRVSAASNITSVAAQTMTVTGGAAAISRSAMLAFKAAAFVTQETTTITPVLNPLYFWLKNPSRPSLNTLVEITACTEITRRSRTGIFDVLGRNNPVVVSDVQSSRAFTIEIDVKGYSAVRDMDNRLSTGEPLFLQGPNQDDFVPTTYVVAGDVSVRQDAKGSDSTTFVIPLTESAKPGSAVYGDTYVWSDVYGSYATWTDVIAGVATWSNLIDKVSNSVVIVP